MDPQETGVRPITESVRNSLDGQEAIGCRVLKDATSNAKTIRDEVLAVVEEFRGANRGTPFEIYTILD